MIKKAIKKKEFWGCYLFAFIMATITEYKDFVEQMGFAKSILIIIIGSIMSFLLWLFTFTCLESLCEKITSKFNR